MALYTKIVERMHSLPIKQDNKEERSALKVIVGELQRLGYKIPSDEECLKVLAQLKKDEEKLLKYSGEAPSVYTSILEEYLPKKATESDIRKYISDNISLSDYPNRGQIIGVVVKAFKGKADGRVVKSIVESL